MSRAKKVEPIIFQHNHINYELMADANLCLECKHIFPHSDFYSNITGMDRQKLGQHDGHTFIMRMGGSNRLSMIVFGSSDTV